MSAAVMGSPLTQATIVEFPLRTVFSNIRPKALGVTLVTLSSRYDQHYAQAHY